MQIKILLLLFINLNAMNTDTIMYKIMPTRECILYLKKSGLTIQDNSSDTINSKSGLVYILPNKQVILIPTNFDENYPGFIFYDKATFLNYRNLDFFPIGEDEMTWSERYNKQIKQFRTNPGFFSEPLRKILDVHLPFQNINEIKSAFLRLQSKLSPSNNSLSSRESEDLLNSFGLGVINYLIEYKNFEIIVENRYENYNPIAYPMVIHDNKRLDVLSKCMRYIFNAGSSSFNSFAISVGLLSDQ